ncbi:cobalamin ECF transporter [Enterococcus sp. DIV0876]|uniref:cobalamin ECF transporter n=1 Tax=Enterococcus sp. DIV0876 TaxID=2774633 RepID=UPI003D2FD2D7
MNTHFPIRRITHLALFSAACIVGRLAFTWLPNIQPMSAILLLLACYGRYSDALIVAVISLLGTNLYLGMGSWTISQLVAFTCMVTFFYLLTRMPYIRRHLQWQAAGAFLCGIIYGLCVSRVEVYLYQLPSYWAYYIQGVFFDLLHGSGNLMFYLLLTPVYRRLFLPRIGKMNEE